jgi:hypothetical protein
MRRTHDRESAFQRSTFRAATRARALRRAASAQTRLQLQVAKDVDDAHQADRHDGNPK